MDSEIRQAYRDLLRKFRNALPLHLDQYCGELGITFGQCDVLLEIEARGQTNLTDLAAAFGLDKSTLSRTVDGLVELGYVDRSTDPSDRRCNILTLTHEGSSVTAAINASGNACADDVLARIPEERRQQAIEGFRLLTRALREHATHEGRCRFQDSDD